MSTGKRYVLDANVFIRAENEYYHHTLCPGFWLALSRQHGERRVFSVRQNQSRTGRPRRLAKRMGSE